MRMSRLILLVALAVTVLSHRSDGQGARPVAEQLRLAGAVPRGAIVYAQARDLAALMKTWLASPVRTAYYESPSFRAFSRSRIYLKLQDRKKDFEAALGFGLDEARLAELAGGASAIAIYDIGKLDVVFVTEVSRERAIATAMFKLAPQFQERSADGATYYVRDVTTDGGRLSQQFCFAYAGGKLLVTTSEGLMVRALGVNRASASESLLSDVLATANKAAGFAANEMTLWLDQARLNRNRYFNNNWIHMNSTELERIETGLIAIRFAPDGLQEHRWFTLKVEPGGSDAAAMALTAEQSNALARFAPSSAQLVKLRSTGAGGEEMVDAVTQSLFGQLPDGGEARPGAPDHTRSTSAEGDEHPPAGRYARLDTRFDRDVDDAQALAHRQQAGGGALPAATARRRLPSALGSLLKAVTTGSYLEVARSNLGAASPFVTFERGIIMELKAAGGVDRAALEGAITDELKTRYVVAGIEAPFTWQEETGTRYVTQSLLERAAAYSVSGRFLVLASSKEFARDILQASIQPAAGQFKFDGTGQYFALVRVAAAMPVFDNLMSKLDGRFERGSAAGGQGEGDGEIKFFSQNLSTLIAASSIKEMRLRRETSGNLMVERVVYPW